MSKITVSSCFDGGNGEFAKVVPGSPTEVHVNVKDDVHTELEQKYHKQWFYFRVSGCRQGEGNNQLKFVLANAGACSYPTAWAGYNVCASYDHKNWFRVPSEYDSGAGHLHWTMEMTSDQVYFAYFAPYSHERHLDLIAKCNALASSKCPGDLTNRTEVSVRALGNTLDGRSMDLVAIGSNLRCCAAPTVCHALSGWLNHHVITRQRAAEGLGDRETAPGRDHGRVLHGGLHRAPAGRARPRCPTAAQAGHLLLRAEHVSR
jgi:hypothetical protein